MSGRYHVKGSSVYIPGLASRFGAYGSKEIEFWPSNGQENRVLASFWQNTPPTHLNSSLPLRPAPQDPAPDEALQPHVREVSRGRPPGSRHGDRVPRALLHDLDDRRRVHGQARAVGRAHPARDPRQRGARAGAQAALQGAETRDVRAGGLLRHARHAQLARAARRVRSPP